MAYKIYVSGDKVVDKKMKQKIENQIASQFKTVESETIGGNEQHDVVNHPRHYTQGKIEVVDFILDQKLSFLEGNVVKYVCRYKLKNGIEDLKKANWYLGKLIKTLEPSKNNSLDSASAV